MLTDQTPPLPPPDNPPAFPRPISVWESDGRELEYHEAQTGMTLRDYFAGLAMAAILSRPAHDQPSEHLEVFAYRYADLMLRERQNPRR